MTATQTAAPAGNAPPPGFAGSACPHDCPSTCALDVERLDARTIGRVRGAPGQSYTAGAVCAKVARYAERTHHPGRLRHPLRRTPGGHERISWDDALDETAEAFLRAEQRYGAEAVWPYFYAGTMGLLQRDGIERLRHVKKYSGQHSTICNTLVRAGWYAGVGALRGPDPREMARADLIVSWGGNPASTQVNAMTHIQRARKTRGAKLVVIDPYRTRTAQVADMHLAVRPGTDGALACAVMHALFRDGYADRGYMAHRTDCPERLERHLRTRTPEWAAGITGLPAAEIEAFAKLYGETERTYIRVGYGFSRSRNGAAAVHAVSCLPGVTGAWRREGAGAAPRREPDFGSGLSAGAAAKRSPLRALPLGLALHLAGGLAAFHAAAGFRADRLPEPAAHRVRLASLPPAASRLGDSLVSARTPEGNRTPTPTVPVPPRPAEPVPVIPRPADLAPMIEMMEMLEMLDEVRIPPAAPEALRGGVRSAGVLGRPDGALGGLPGGVPGGSIHGLRGEGDPDLPPPDTPPRPLAMPRPRFPAEALRDGVRGSVVLRALITPRGTVEVLRILRSVPGLDREAVRVVESEWRFRPAQLRGRPIPALSDLSVRFSLR